MALVAQLLQTPAQVVPGKACPPTTTRALFVVVAVNVVIASFVVGPIVVVVVVLALSVVGIFSVMRVVVIAVVVSRIIVVVSVSFVCVVVIVFSDFFILFFHVVFVMQVVTRFVAKGALLPCFVLLPAVSPSILVCSGTFKQTVHVGTNEQNQSDLCKSLKNLRDLEFYFEKKRSKKL